jgi:glucose/arabinose dehydrogenase
MKLIKGGIVSAAFVLAAISIQMFGNRTVQAQVTTPTVVDPNLTVSTVVSGLTTPTSMAFLGPNEFFVLEKATGQVKHVIRGAVQSVVLDLAVNNSSERGLLGIALHPNFPVDPGVYLYWTCQAPPPPPSDPFFPTLQECPDRPSFGADISDILAVPLLGNRVDRFVWNGTTLTFDHNLIKLHAFQNDAAPVPPGQNDSTQPARGNHNAGILRFGPDGKLYIVIGDNGRRGQLQNLITGPTPGVPDDQFGGPDPDNNHYTGVIIRLNDDGSVPADNPLSPLPGMTAEDTANIRRTFAYGIRNTFGMAFDPIGGSLWIEENGDDSFDVVRRVTPGLNGGWIQTLGPVSRLAQWKEIETTFGDHQMQQFRYPPTNIANSPQEALSRLVMFPGAHYNDPEFSWKWAVAPAGLGFLNGRALGPQYDGDLFMGAATPALVGGYLFRFNLTGNRQKIGVDDPRLEDRVADNNTKFDITESESLLFGMNFGVGTDIQTGPDGNLYVVSLSKGAVYVIQRASR